MALIRWSPFGDMDRMFDEEDWDMVPSFFPKESFSAPAVDLYEEDGNVVAEAEIPNMKPEDIDISIEDDLLTIEGSSEEKEEKKDKHFYKREIRRGQFSRRIALPQSVKSEEADASYDDGVLKVTMPKEKIEKSKKVKVDVK